MNHPQTIARVFGVLYLMTFITSIPAFFFYAHPYVEDEKGYGYSEDSVA